MASQKPMTGIKSLDKDLQLLFEAKADARLPKIKEALDGYASAVKTLQELPDGLIRVLITLSIDEQYESLQQGASDEARVALENAKRLIQESVPELDKNPVFTSLVKRERTERDDPCNVIEGLSWETHWVGKPPELRPVARILFLAERDRLLLDSSLEWDDLLFLSRSFARILAKQLKQAAPLAEHGLLKVPEPALIARRIREIDSCLSTIKELFTGFGIDWQNVSDEEETEE